LSRQTIGNYENGRTHPSRAAILLWAVACGVSVDWLETGEPDPENPGPGLPITYTATDLNCEPADYVFSAPTLRAA
jgi:transcriptional regulator with XRE-family HTH domain